MTRYNVDQMSEFVDEFYRLVGYQNRVSANLAQLEQKQKIYRLLKGLSWFLFGVDVWFTYQGVTLYSSSWQFGAFSAVAVGGLQWSVSESIMSRSLRSLLTVDKNDDGKAGMDEWARWGITVGSLVLAYGLDLATNLMAIDRGALGQIPFELVNVTSNGTLVNLVAFLICAALTFSDEMIRNLADNRLAQLAMEEPMLTTKYGVLEAQIASSRQFAKELIARATEEGRKNGRNFKI